MAKLLFKTGFGGTVAVDPFLPGTETLFKVRYMQGSDIPSYDFDMSFRGGNAWTSNVFGSAQPTPVDMNDYFNASIETVTGHLGDQTPTLKHELVAQGSGSDQSTQMWYEMRNTTGDKLLADGDLYCTYWMKHNASLAVDMGENNFSTVFEWKSATTDYRIVAAIYTGIGAAAENLTWNCVIDGPNSTPDSGPYYYETSGVTPVAGEWFKVEAFYHRSEGLDGRFYFAIDGVPLFDTKICKYGSNGSTINRLFLWGLYSAPLAVYPMPKWIDDVEIWDGFPNGTPAYVPTP